MAYNIDDWQRTYDSIVGSPYHKSLTLLKMYAGMDVKGRLPFGDSYLRCSLRRAFTVTGLITMEPLRALFSYLTESVVKSHVL